MSAAQFVRLVPLAYADDYRRVTVECRHTCAAHERQPLIVTFSGERTASHTGTVHECGCTVVVPFAVWKRFVALSAFEYAVWCVREGGDVCGVK